MARAQRNRTSHFLAEHMPLDTGFHTRAIRVLEIPMREFAQPALHARVAPATGIDRLAWNPSPVVCYLKTQQPAKAHEVLTSGAEVAMGLRGSQDKACSHSYPSFRSSEG